MNCSVGRYIGATEQATILMDSSVIRRSHHLLIRYITISQAQLIVAIVAFPKTAQML